MVGSRAILVHPVCLTGSGHGGILKSRVKIMVVGGMGETCKRIILESGERLFTPERVLVSFNSWLSVCHVPLHDLLPSLAEELKKTI